MNFVIAFAIFVTGSMPGLGHSSSKNEDKKTEDPARLQGGKGTQLQGKGAQAFSLPAANISFSERADFNLGNALFRRVWVSSPASTASADGLGPLFNARSCQRCHIKDGRGHPPTANPPKDNAVSMLIRLSVPPKNANQVNKLHSEQVSGIDEPTYGGQLQDSSIQGHEPEGKVYVSWKKQNVKFADGSVVSLRKPKFEIKDLKYGPMHPEVMMSPRVAPQLIGLGLLEAVSETSVLTNEDPLDLNNDGISGRANRVQSAETQKLALGRFGWKASQPSLNQQNQGAFLGDMGLSGPLFQKHAGDCTSQQEKCLKAPHGQDSESGDVEISEQMAKLVLFYTRHLAVPARRNHKSEEVVVGEKLFRDLNCHSCHVPHFKTRKDAASKALSNQDIWPYTDMLLHDMGPGLADNRPDALANGQEWRTPPLWGIGYTKEVSGHTQFLHDGRARSIEEAILWHGGEASASKDKFLKLSKSNRMKILSFLNSL